MKKKLLILLITLLTVKCYSQISFEKGYYINHLGERFECLIKNSDWRSTPLNFKYKLQNSNDIKKGEPNSIKEFGIYNSYKYVSSKVNIDQSNHNYNYLTYNRNPEFKSKILFLKVLVEGENSLYEFSKIGLRLFFFKKGKSEIEQLIFKSYKTSEEEIKKNSSYKRQLWNNFKCLSIKKNKLENLDYTKKSLVNFFVTYNKCKNSKFILHEKKHKKPKFNLTIRPRIRNSSFSLLNNERVYLNSDFDNTIGFGIGTEAELVLPFNKNKWSVFIEPTYHKYSSSKSNDIDTRYFITGNKVIADANYNYLEVSFGLRHYFFLNNRSKIFLNYSYVPTFQISSEILLSRIDGSSLTSPEINGGSITPSSAFGIGYELNKYNIEIRLISNRDILKNTPWDTNYNTLSFIFGYSLFK